MLDPIAMKNNILQNILSRLPVPDNFILRQNSTAQETTQTEASAPADFGDLVRTSAAADSTTAETQTERATRDIIAAAQRNELTPDMVRDFFRAENLHISNSNLLAAYRQNTRFGVM